MDCHIEFIKSSITVIIKKWIDNGCVESSNLKKLEYTNFCIL